MFTLHQIGFGFYVLRRLLLPALGREPEVEGRRRLSSEVTTSKSAIVHLVCVIIMYIIYQMYKDVASSRSSYAILKTEAFYCQTC